MKKGRISLLLLTSCILLTLIGCDSSADKSVETTSNKPIEKSEQTKKEIKLTGWQQNGNTYYYYDNNGDEKTGWIQDSGKWYYLNKDGSMAHDTTIDGYQIDANGVMQEKTQSNNTSKSASNKVTSNSSSEGTTTNEPASNEKTVYWVSSGKSYHYDKNCPTLARSKNISSGPGSSCPKKDPCDKCAK